MSEFFLGTHRPNWLAKTAVPLFVSRNQLHKIKRLPRALGDVGIDSGGFSELSRHGYWTIGVDQYVREVRRYRDEIGNLRWAAQQDWMCEPHILKKTGLTINEHHRRSTNNVLDLRSAAPELDWTIVIQGWKRDDYLRHVDMLTAAGIDLGKEAVVGIGSVCRRQATGEVEEIIEALSPYIKLHGFGFKLRGLERCAHLLKSSDSMAWSFAARKQDPLPGHEVRHKNCANCFDFAMQWHDRLLSKMDSWRQKPRQMGLNFIGGANVPANETRCSAA